MKLLMHTGFDWPPRQKPPGPSLGEAVLVFVGVVAFVVWRLFA